jgi:hypothetical protein
VSTFSYTSYELRVAKVLLERTTICSMISFARNKVFVAIVITGLEGEHGRQAWWKDNEERFANQDMASQTSRLFRGKVGIRNGI